MAPQHDSDPVSSALFDPENQAMIGHAPLRDAAITI
jgi:hypothetical protein